MMAIEPRQTKVEPEIVDLTQADLDRGMTAEEIARDRADLNVDRFCRGLAAQIKQQAISQADVVTESAA